MRCNRCNEEYQESTYSGICKKCYKKEYYLRNKSKLNAQSRIQYDKIRKQEVERACPCCQKIFKTKYKKKMACSKSCSNKMAPSHQKDRVNTYFRDRYHSNLNAKLSQCIRTRVHKALNGAYKRFSVTKHLGCTPDELRQHLESKFQPGMSWDNHGDSAQGARSWEIDHIEALYKFDLSDEGQFRKACHFTNLQPLWQDENARKDARR